MVGDTWSPTASMRTLNYFLADASKHKARVCQLDFIEAFLKTKVTMRKETALKILALKNPIADLGVKELKALVQYKKTLAERYSQGDK